MSPTAPLYQAQPELVAAAFLILYMVLDQPFLYQSVLAARSQPETSLIGVALKPNDCDMRAVLALLAQRPTGANIGFFVLFGSPENCVAKRKYSVSDLSSLAVRRWLAPLELLLLPSDF